MKIFVNAVNGVAALRISRRKNLAVIAVFLLTVIAVIRINNEMGMGGAGDWTVPRPLFDSKNEARRLLALLTHVAYQCNETLLGGWNITLWPICLDTLSPSLRVAYTIGRWPDYSLESVLAHNHSFSVFLVSGSLPIVRWPNTTVLRLNVVPNDPADFARNSYDQRTMNDLWETKRTAGIKGVKGKNVGLFRVSSGLTAGVEAWELLLLMIKDELMNRVDLLQLEIYIDHLDEEYLFNWYRTLHALFTHSHLALYNTASNDERCLHVTLMHSCVFMLSFARIANGNQNFPASGITVGGKSGGKTATMGSKYVLHPPADFGTEEEEVVRLKDFLSTIQTDCEIKVLGEAGSKHSNQAGSGPGARDLRVRPHPAIEWNICPSRFHSSCSVVRIRLQNDADSITQELAKDFDCFVFTFILQPWQPFNNSATKHKTSQASKHKSNDRSTSTNYNKNNNGIKYSNKNNMSGSRRNESVSYDGIMDTVGSTYLHANQLFTTSLPTYKLYRRLPGNRGVDSSRTKSCTWQEMVETIREFSPISLLEVDAPSYEWYILRLLMDQQALENVTQLVARLHCRDIGPLDFTDGASSSEILLSHYSELRRVESFGLSLFSSAAVPSTNRLRHSIMPPSEALLTRASDLDYNVGFVRTRFV